MPERGRQREAEVIAVANRIEAVVRLCFGRIDNWDDFLRGTDAAESAQWERRKLKHQSASALSRTRELIAVFNNFLFRAATEATFKTLFNEIKAGIPVGLRMPVREFEERISPLRREVEKGRDQSRPFHSTISITLLGLRYEYPEWHFANDIAVALTEIRRLERDLEAFSRDPGKPASLRLSPALKQKWVEAQPLARQQAAALRWCVIACCSLIEAYLSGLAWRLQQTGGERLSAMSMKDRKIIEDTGSSFRDRLVRIPHIVAGCRLWGDDAEIQGVLTLKQARDALMHPSPFSVSGRYGGRDKLSLIYELRHDAVEAYVHDTVNVLKRIYYHIYGEGIPLPDWLKDLCILTDGS